MKALSAGIIPVFYETPAEPSYLLLRAYNYWDFPKGEVDAGEDALTAAIRELEEETGLLSPEFIWGKAFYETEVYSRGKTARYYLARVESKKVTLGINPLIGRAEHSEFRWLKYEKAHGLLVPRVQKALEWAREQLND